MALHSMAAKKNPFQRKPGKFRKHAIVTALEKMLLATEFQHLVLIIISGMLVKFNVHILNSSMKNYKCTVNIGGVTCEQLGGRILMHDCRNEEFIT